MPEPESLEFETPDGTVRIDGWTRDRRRTQKLRVTLEDGRLMHVQGFRYAWEVWLEGEPERQAAGELTGCMASVLGHWDDSWPNEWPEWFWWLERRLGGRRPG